MRPTLRPVKGRPARCSSFDRAVHITIDRWTEYVAKSQREAAAASTIMNERAALSLMFTLAVEAQRLYFKPALPGVRADNVRQLVLEDEEVLVIIEQLDKTAPDIADAIEFMWFTGWRTSEVLPLRWNQVDVARGIIHWEVGTTKNKQGPTLAYDALPGLVELIQRREEYTDRCEREQERMIKWVFHRESQKIQSKRFYKHWHAAVERAAYGGKTEEPRAVVYPNLVAYKDENGKLIRPIPHNLRRSAVVRMERAGIPRSAATSITGHQTESVYTRYAIARAAEQREQLKKIASLRRAVDNR